MSDTNDTDYSSLNQEVESVSEGKTYAIKKRFFTFQNMFFWFAGIVSLLPFNTLVSMDSFWRSKFKSNATAVYPFISNGGGLVALIFYEKLNRLFSFKTQLKIFPIITASTFPLLYTIGILIPKNDSSWWGIKNIIFMMVVFFQCFINSMLQVSITLVIQVLINIDYSYDLYIQLWSK